MAKKIGVLADSGVDLLKGLAKVKDINLVPVSILINDEPKLHGVEIINQEVVEHLLQKDDVKTAPATPRAYYLKYKKLSEEYDKIYTLATTSELSKCYENARRGLQWFKKKQKLEENGIIHNDIKVIDSRTASISLGQIVNRVADIVKTDVNPAKLDKYIAWLISKAVIFFVVDDLYWLKKSGKLNMFSGFVGKMLDIKPVIKIEDGSIVPVEKPRGKDTAIDTMVNIIKQSTPKYKRGVEIWVAHSASLLDAKYAQKQLSTIFNIKEKKIPIVEIGPTMTAHTGPGVVSVSILPK
jgi:DegV family protein with EDD domain